MRRIVTAAAVAVAATMALAVALPAAAASRPEAEQKKIDYLLGEVKASSATFIRNGQEYQAEKAVSHLKRKLMFAGGRVQTARQFIVGVASRSEESKEPYKMRLPAGATVELGTWLMERLVTYEDAHGEGPHAKQAAAAEAPKS